MRTEEGGIEKKLKVGMRKWDPSSSDKAGLPSSPSATPRQDAAAEDAAFDKLRRGKVGSKRKWE
jgi:hypothetical protein